MELLHTHDVMFHILFLNISAIIMSVLK